MMELLYNSDAYAVMQVEIPAADAGQAARGGYEIVDKLAGRGIYLEGDVARVFHEGVQMLAKEESGVEAFDAYLERYAPVMQRVALN